jgi:hypothetical protein
MNFKSFGLAGCLLSVFTVSPALAITPGMAVSGTAFAQLSSSLDQQPQGWVKFESKDALRNMTSTANSVTVQQEGTYLIIASPQVTAMKDGGCLDAWITINGKNLANSGVRICQSKAGNTNVVVSQSIIALKKGDIIQVKSSGTNAKLDAITAQGAPLIPSIIFTVLGLY